jgi:hypothetical protein
LIGGAAAEKVPMNRSRRMVNALSYRKNIKTRGVRKSLLPAIPGVIALTLLGSVLGYLILVFHQD